jgi:hypothetical protein
VLAPGRSKREGNPDWQAPKFEPSAGFWNSVEKRLGISKLQSKGEVMQLTIQDWAAIDAAQRACNELVEVVKPRGRLSECKARGEVSSRAKWLLTALGKLREELRPAPERK